MTDTPKRRRRPAPTPDKLFGKPLFIGLAAGAAIVGLPVIVMALSGGPSAAESVRAIDAGSESGLEELRQVKIELMKKALDAAGARAKTKTSATGQGASDGAASGSRTQQVRDKILANSAKALDLSIQELVAAHKENPIAAVNQYRGRLIRIRGEVVSIRSSLTLSVRIADSEGKAITIHMLPSEKPGLAELSPGEDITILAVGKAQSYQAFPLINGVLAP